jgi:Fic-DOC domain mobile mystery protein B
MIDEWQPIDGETPIDDLSHLIDKSIRTRSELNIVEAENIRKAVVKYLAAKPNSRTAPFTDTWMRKVHESMFGDVWTWAGEARTSNTIIGCDWTLIGQELANLSLDVQAWTDTWPRIEQAAMLHHRAVHIHPFPNGNGRWSRLLANIWLSRHGEKIVEWPDPEMGKPDSSIRGKYILALRAADEFDMNPLNELHKQYRQA